MTDAPSAIKSSATRKSAAGQSRAGRWRPNSTIAATTTATLAVWPTAHATPRRQASRSRPCRVASVETAARWSGSNAWRNPSRRPRPARARRPEEPGVMAAANVAYSSGRIMEPGMIAASHRQALEGIHARYAPVDARVAEILENIRRDCRELSSESRNQGNERQVEEFIARLSAEFGDRTLQVTRGTASAPVGPADASRWDSARRRTDLPCVVIERQRLSQWAVRTTRWNYLFTVPGESEDTLILVAHYDTWRGPGADDNTTGEEILKQYLLSDLRAARRPALTHTYFMAGSEECGLVGLTSQILLALGLQAANLALTQRAWLYGVLALALAPLASYRFGVSGSREYVKALTQDELRRIRAVISVDSVGEGRLYIPRGTLGADFLRVLIPFEDYDSLNDLLEEAAHLHGIRYNNFLAGGTTDHVSFLEVHNGLWARLRAAVSRSDAPFLIPAS